VDVHRYILLRTVHAYCMESMLHGGQQKVTGLNLGGLRCRLEGLEVSDVRCSDALMF
jgi:hypothetical protein